MAGKSDSSDDARVTVYESSGNSFVNQYVVLRHLSRSPQATVKLCMHVKTKKYVVIKVFNQYTKNTIHELELMKHLEHPFLVKTAEVIRDPTKSTWIIVTHYVEGGRLMNFSNVTQKLARFKLSQIRRFALQLLSVLQYLHDKNLVHGDLTLHNILKTSDGLSVKVCDLSQCVRADVDPEMQPIARTTLAYCAPERLDDEKGLQQATFSSDLWAFGVCLYTMLHGYLPFRDTNTLGLWRKIKSGRPPISNRIPDDLRDLLRRLLHQDVTKRMSVQQISRHRWVKSNVLKSSIYASMLVSESGLGLGLGLDLLRLQKFCLKSAAQWSAVDDLNLQVSMEQINFKAGDRVVEEGHTGSSIFLIQSGQCEMHLENSALNPQNYDIECSEWGMMDPQKRSLEFKNKKNLDAWKDGFIEPDTMHIREEGDIVGEGCVLRVLKSEQDSMILPSVTARTDVKATRINVESLLRLYGEDRLNELKKTAVKYHSKTISLLTLQSLYKKSAAAPVEGSASAAVS